MSVCVETVGGSLARLETDVTAVIGTPVTSISVSALCPLCLSPLHVSNGLHTCL